MLAHHVANVHQALEIANARLIPHPLIVSNIRAAEVSRLTRFAKGIASDFDGTLTRSKSHWYFLERFMPPEYREEQDRHRAEYHAEMHRMSEAELLKYDMDRVRLNFVAYNNAGLGPAAFAKAGRMCQPRHEVKELFRLFSKRAVVSYGLDHSIRAFLNHHEIPHDAIKASKVIFPTDGNGCSADEVVVTNHKGECAQTFMDEHRLTANEVIRVGDSWGDRLLFSSDSLNVFMLPPNEPEPDVHAGRLRAIEKLWDRVPLLILASDSFIPLNILTSVA